MSHRKDVRTKDIDVSPFKVKNRLNPDCFDEDGMLIWGAVKVRPDEGGTRGPLRAVLVTPWKKIQFGK